MTESLVTVARGLTVLEAELARIQLGFEGIVGFLVDVETVNWFWHYTVAVRGAKLQVPAADAERARDVLAAQSTAAIVAPTTRTCGHCGEMLDGAWLVCWRCGTDVEGKRDETFFIEELRRSATLEGLSQPGYLIVVVFACALLMTQSLPVALLVGMLLVIMLASEHEVVHAKMRPDANAALPASWPKTEAGDAICRLAMASAMFGLGWLPPLSLYSLRLLYQSHLFAVSPRGNRWRIVAWVLNLVVLGLFMTVLVLLALPGIPIVSEWLRTEAV